MEGDPKGAKMKRLGYDLDKFEEKEEANTEGSIPKIQKILYATDLSENSAYAGRYTVKMAEQNNAEVYVLHVLEPPKSPSFPPEEEKLKKLSAKQKEMAKDKMYKRLIQFCQQELQGNTNIILSISSIEVVEGDPAEKILQKADELKADMVVMGTHGKGWLAHTFLGSQAQKVLQRIKIPVLIIPLPDKKKSAQPK